MRNILLTGGTGFIGNHILRELSSDASNRIVVLSRDKHPDTGNVTYVVGDIADTDLVAKCVSRVEYVIHCAGVKASSKDCVPTNVLGTQNITKACERGNIRKLVHLSSVGVIGAENDAVITEQTPCSPKNEYERTKYQAELLVSKLAQDIPGKAVILRPTNVYGENDPELHLLNLFKKIKSDAFRFVGHDISRFWLNYLHVREISCLFPRLLSWENPNTTYIVNTPAPLEEFVVTIRDIFHDRRPLRHLPYWPAKMLAKCFDQVPSRILNHPPINSRKLEELTNKRKYSADLLVKDLGWSPVFTLRQSLSSLIRDYDEKGMWR